MKKLFSIHPLGVKLWYGRGCPLHPYIEGRLIDLCRERFQPKDSSGFLRTKSSSLMNIPLWMSQWCDYLHWYCTVALHPAVTLMDFMEAPSVIIRF